MTIKIHLLQDIHADPLLSGDLPSTYPAGTDILVDRADNLPEDSAIGFWVVQDGWEDDGYGFAVYKDTDYRRL